jgi:hypothetical protein
VASAARNPNGAAAATATNSRRFIDTNYDVKAALGPRHNTAASFEA